MKGPCHIVSSPASQFSSPFDETLTTALVFDLLQSGMPIDNLGWPPTGPFPQSNYQNYLAYSEHHRLYRGSNARSRAGPPLCREKVQR